MFFHEISATPLPVNYDSRLSALSYDGNIVAGYTRVGDYGIDSLRYTVGDGTDSFENPDDEFDEIEAAEDVSADGSVVVGTNGICASWGCFGFFIWKASTGKIPISLPDPGDLKTAISGDGKTILISADEDFYRWTELNGYEWLAYGHATDISTDGRVIVGTTPTGQAFRYTSTDGIEEIGDFTPSKTNFDGSMIIGGSYIWSEANGLQSIRDYFISRGIDLDSDGWNIGSARDISDDGGVILGVGSKDGATNWWIATLDIVAVDNRDDQFSKAGKWSASNKASGFYGPDYFYAASGTGSSVATFTFEIPTTGNYAIYALWPAHYSRASNTPFRLINNGSAVDTIRVSQKENGGKFNPLAGPLATGPGIYTLGAGILEVTVANDADGKVAADAVRVLRLAAPDIVDNRDAQFSKAGNWGASNKAAGFYGLDYFYATSGTGSSVATFTFQIPTAGIYAISAQWPAHYSRASNTPYRLTNNGSAVDTIRVNQKESGGIFNPLTGPLSSGPGIYTLNAGVREVTIDNDADGKVAADAVRVLRLNQ